MKGFFNESIIIGFMKEDSIPCHCTLWRIFVFLSLLIFLIYSNTFNASFHLDDFHSIVQNTKLQIDNLYPRTIFDAVTGNKPFFRPVSNLSIALNWYFGKDDVTGYHYVNLTVHILTTFFLFLTIINLFNSPNLVGKYKKNKFFIAVLATTLWAINPIQTQAITYIVQRMAALAAMFYVMGLYCYIKARISNSVKDRFFWLLGLLISFLMAVGSKENAIMLPISLLILEMIFFQDMSNSKVRKFFFLSGCVLILIVFVSGVFLFMNGSFVDNILGGYKNRTFTIYERLLTEPRIVVFYLSQIFYPIADRLSLDHDIVLSTSLFTPWTTLPTILFIVSLAVTAIWQMKKSPLYSFAILFFLVNHVIESSIIPLELLFEHRNYLPSLFLFLPVTAVIKRSINYYMEEKKRGGMGVLLICFTVILLVMLGLGTYVRNMVWTDERTLFEDTIQKAPARARPYQNLASDYFIKTGDYEKAMALYKKSMYLDDNTRHKSEVISLINMANVYAKQKKNYKKVAEIYKRVLSLKPGYSPVLYHLCLTLIQMGEMEEALVYIDQLLSKYPESAEYLNAKAFILIKQNDLDNALTYLIKAIEKAPDDEKILLSLGLLKNLSGKYVSAEHYLKRLYNRNPKNITALLLLIENSVNSGNIQQAEIYAENLISEFSVKEISISLEQKPSIVLQWMLKRDHVVPVIVRKMIEQANVILGH
jgi:Tfp pilus assembly protein PilF